MKQASLFEILTQKNFDELRGIVGLMPAVRAAMNSAARADEEGRKLLLDRLNDVAKREGVSLTRGGGKEIKMDTFNKWLQPTDKDHAPTFEGIICFCLATSDARPLKPILDMLGLTVIDKADLQLLRYGKACARMKSAREELKNAEALL